MVNKNKIFGYNFTNNYNKINTYQGSLEYINVFINKNQSININIKNANKNCFQFCIILDHLKTTFDIIILTEARTI